MIVYVKITSPLEYQVFDEPGEGLFEVEEWILDAIGRTAQFNPATGALMEYYPEATTASYSERVNTAIRERYTVDEELAILRQRDSKPAEFKEYFDYCEKCKKDNK